jgi:hypothetical protein
MSDPQASGAQKACANDDPSRDRDGPRDRDPPIAFAYTDDQWQEAYKVALDLASLLSDWFRFKNDAKFFDGCGQWMRDVFACADARAVITVNSRVASGVLIVTGLFESIKIEIWVLPGSLVDIEHKDNNSQCNFRFLGQLHQSVQEPLPVGAIRDLIDRTSRECKLLLE